MTSETPHSSNNVPFIDAILPALGGLLGGGVFLLPAMATDAAGPAAIAALLLAAGLGLALARLSVSTDAPDQPFARFLPAWIGVAGRVAAVASLATIFAAYLLPHGSENAHHIAAVGVVLVASLLVGLGMRPSPSAVAIACGAAVVSLGFYVGLAAPLMSRPSFIPVAPHGWGAVPATAGLLFFLFGGLEYPTCLYPVIANSRRAIPRSAVLGAAMMAVIAGIVMIVSIGVGGSAFTTHRLFAKSADHAPLLAIAAATGQPVAMWGLSVGAVVACAVAIHRLLSEAAESLGSLGRLGFLPGALGAISPNAEAPWAGVLFAGTIAAGLASFAPVETTVLFAAGALLVGYACRVAVRGWAWLLGAVAVLAFLMPASAWRWVGAIAVLGAICYAARGLWKTEL